MSNWGFFSPAATIARSQALVQNMDNDERFNRMNAELIRLRSRLAEALWLVENGTPHDRMISAGRWDEWLNRRNAILGWADDSGRPADSAKDREDV